MLLDAVFQRKHFRYGAKNGSVLIETKKAIVTAAWNAACMARTSANVRPVSSTLAQGGWKI